MECVDSLEDRQPEVIRKRYQEGRTWRHIGADFGVTREVIRQTERKALRALSRPQIQQAVKAVHGYLRPWRLPGTEWGDLTASWTSSTERAALKELDWEERFQEHARWLEKYREKLQRNEGMA